jgi:rhamnosyltransferase
MLTELEKTDYPLDLVWKGVVRSAEPRHVYTNLSLLEILPDADSGWRPDPAPRIAVLAHIYYDDMVEQIMRYLINIPVPYCLYVTTDTEAKRDSISAQLGADSPGHVEVRVVESNRGRDTSALLIACRDVLLSDEYDLVCRVHSKRSPQDDFNAASLFAAHMFDNLLFTPGYVAEVLRLFQQHPTLGMAFPPVVNIAYPTLGHAWFTNRPLAEQVAKDLGIVTHFDSTTPIAPYGSMFWARPAALRAMVEHPWKWTDFPDEGGYQDGSLTHVLERLLGYTALSAGYHVRSVINRDWGSINYTFLEYKLQRVSSMLPAHTEDQVQFIRASVVEQPLLARLKDELDRQHPRLGATLRPAYRAARVVYRRARRT